MSATILVVCTSFLAAPTVGARKGRPPLLRVGHNPAFSTVAVEFYMYMLHCLLAPICKLCGYFSKRKNVSVVCGHNAASLSLDRYVLAVVVLND